MKPLFTLPTDLSYAAVTANGPKIPLTNGTAFDVANADDRELDLLLLERAESAPERVIVRDAGGCKGRIKELMPTLFGFYGRGSRHEANGKVYGFRGFRFSGGTDTSAITNVPYYLSCLYDCISGSTTPRTAQMALHGAGAGKPALTVDSYGTGLVVGQHSATMVQENVRNVLTWAGDLRSYLRFMATAKRHDFAVGVTVCNGGDISIDEALLAWMNGIPVILLEGTERAADQLVTAFRKGTLKDEFIASFDKEGRELSDELDDRDLIDSIDFPALTRIAKFDESLSDLGASSLAEAQYELGLLTEMPEVEAAAA